VSWLAPQADGLLDFAQLEEALREDTQLVSIMYVNNETGVVQDIARIGTLCRQRGVLFHVDAAQAVGKLDFQVSQLPIDFLAMTAHKFYGPKGIGALYIADRPGCRVEPIMFGGGQERRMRPGTLPVHQVAGMGVAAELAAQRRQADLSRVGALRRRLWQGIRVLPGLYLNGRENDGYPGILNVSACDIDGESLLLALRPLCVARGSACNTRSGEPSHVLRALGRDDQLAQSAIRFGIGRGNSEQDIDTAVSLYRTAVTRLRRIAPKSAA
jgi:cysteine desulfurase